MVKQSQKSEIKITHKNYFPNDSSRQSTLATDIGTLQEVSNFKHKCTPSMKINLVNVSTSLLQIASKYSVITNSECQKLPKKLYSLLYLAACTCPHCY